MTSSDFSARYGAWAIVTGASSGIGEAFAHALAARGIRPLLLARRADELARVAAQVTARHGIACATLTADLGDPGFADALDAACEGREIGLVVANAGYNPAGGFLDMPAEMLSRIIDVNDRANVLLANRWLPRLKQRGRGGFLLVASTEAYMPTPYSACYSASKAFVLAFGEALWGEFLDTGVDVLVLSPGATDTPLLASRAIAGIKSMSAREVAEIGLANLGKGPSVIAGKANARQTRMMRLMPRAWLLRKSAPVVRRMVEHARAVARAKQTGGQADS